MAYNPPTKYPRTRKVSPIDTIPDEIARYIMRFCDPDRYLTVGMINKQFNEAHHREEKKTSTMGFLESDTPLVNKDGDNIPPGPETMTELSSSKHLNRLIHRAIERGLDWDHYCVDYPAQHGHKDFFTWLNNSTIFWTPTTAYSSAADTGNLDMMEFMLDSGYGIPDDTCRINATIGKHHHILEWLDQIKSTNRYLLADAVNNNDVQTVIDMYDVDTNHYEWVLHDAVFSGSVDVVEYLLEYGLEPDERDVELACRMNRTDVYLIIEDWKSEN